MTEKFVRRGLSCILVPYDVLEGEDVDVINADGFDSDFGNDDETNNYRKRRLAELSREMEGVINASGQWKYSFYTGQKFTTTKDAKDRVYLHSIESRRNLKLYKNENVRVRTRCDGKVPIFIMSQSTRSTGPNREMEAGPSVASSPTTRSKKKKNICTNDDNQACSYALNAHDKRDLCPWVLIYPLAYALVEAESKSLWCWFLQCLGDDIDLHPNSNFIFISDRQKVPDIH
ncbi:shikimate O-hydroxycinnamoyltransferase [Tanacetum coccineum]